jgi:hypothetical protein
MDALKPYRHVWAVDFEFTAPPGDRPTPICLVARELRTGELVRQWLADGAPDAPPYGTGPDTLFVAYYASAELGCHLALGWPTPTRILDLFAEFRCVTCGLPVPCGNGLLGALAYHGLDGLATVEKQDMRGLAMRGGPYDASEREALLTYCQSDVDALARLLPPMLPHIDLPRALLRGRYMAAAAKIEWQGVPIDMEALERLRLGWDEIKWRLVTEVDRNCNVFVPTGQRVLNPESAFGAAILAEAAAAGVDPHRLAEAVDSVWADERQAAGEVFAARKAARRATGLTARRIDQWEDSGRDSSTYPHLDKTARELARIHPALGIGQGYTGEGGYEDTDYGGRLWDQLRQRDETARPRHHPDILRRAVDLVLSSPAGDADSCTRMSFSTARFMEYLVRRDIPWPRLESGDLALDEDTFREMARAYPVEVGPIRELRHALAQLRLNELAVGTDGRNRVLLSAFGGRTSRNQPSNSRFIFGPSVWLRCLIRPGPGRAVSYVDWCQQELAVAAVLSGDAAMQDAYVSGDFYLSFAKMAGAVPADATKESHGAQREQFKAVALGVMYGLSADGLARKLNIPPCHGRELLRMHRETFRRFWQWAEQVETAAMLGGRLQTVFGWKLHTGPGTTSRSVRNFPVQANAAEMLRLACCLATECGIEVCAPVHDALLVEGASDGIEDVVARTQQAMREASELVLPGFPLRTDAKIVRHPDRYTDPRGRYMWERVEGLLAGLGVDGSDGITRDTPLGYRR